jgi:hypothetical protein
MTVGRLRSFIGMLAVCMGVLAFALLAATDLAPKPIPLTVGSGERLLVVAPHPDDRRSARVV